MKGTNKVWISGNIGGKIIHSQTRDGNPACSFSVASEQGNRPATWARVNCYGELASSLKNKLSKGAYLVCDGELMNRPGQYSELLEIRASNVTIILQGKEDDDYGREWEETGREEERPL
jgi:single-stranded DNA-binding protein